MTVRRVVRAAADRRVGYALTLLTLALLVFVVAVDGPPTLAAILGFNLGLASARSYGEGRRRRVRLAEEVGPHRMVGEVDCEVCGEGVCHYLHTS